MELRQLKYFIQVAESLNFTLASKKLFITQSTISQQIKQLEEELDILLFDRREKKISLTEAGREFLPYATRVIQDAEYGKQRLLDLQNIRTGELAIGVNYSFSSLLTDAVIKFSKKYPGIKLDIQYKTVSELLDLLKKRKVDLVLSYTPLAKEKTIESRDLFETSLSVVVHKNHPLGKRNSISLKELKKYPLALPSKGLHARTMLDSYLFSEHIILHPKIELNEVNILLHLVNTGNWITVLSDSTVCGNDDFKAIPLSGNVHNMQASLMWIKGSYQKFSLKEFRDIIINYTETFSGRFSDSGFLHPDI